MKGFFEEYKWWLIIVLVVPIVVSYIWFTYNGFIPIGDIDKGNWLSFWGGFLAFYGTFFLGMVAIWQNKQSAEQNNRLLDIENSRHSCNVILKNSNSNSVSKCILSKEERDYKNAKRNMRLIIINHGDAMLKKIKIFFPDNQVFLSHIVLAKGEDINVIIEIPRDLNCEKKAKISFISCNDVVTHRDFNIFIKEHQAQIKYYHFYGLQKEEINNEK
jgi:hypothetical protein